MRETAEAASIRLDKLLANLGYGSRRDIRAMARAGRIALAGEAIHDSERRLERLDVSHLTIDGAPIDPLPGLVLMVHKPVGMTCSHDEAGPLVHDLLPDRWRRRDPRLSSVGRLDKDTSGLLLVTDDGPLLHRIISPKTHLPKRYRATLAEALRGDEAALFAAGTLMLKGETKPLLAAHLEMAGPTQAIITIVEGRYHQVRRMFAAVGNRVEALHRDTVGGLSLPPDLEEGAYRVLDQGVVQSIFTIETIARP